MEEFKLREKSYKFDSSGDINLGYDVTMWRSDGGNILVHNVVAGYHPHINNFTHTYKTTTQRFKDLKVCPHSAAFMSFCIDIHIPRCVFTENIQTIEAVLCQKIGQVSLNIEYTQ